MKRKEFLKKSFGFLFLALMVFGVVSCDKDKDEDDSKSEKKELLASSSKTLDLLKSDCKKVVDSIPEAKGMFVEAQYELNYKVSEKNAEEISPIAVTYIHYWWKEAEHHSYVIYQQRDFKEDKLSDIQVTTPGIPWLGDHQIASLDNLISLEQAIKNVKDSKFEDPQTVFVTLRHPVIANDNGHPMYVFGGSPSRVSHIMVDATNGEVIEFRDDKGLENFNLSKE